MLPILTVLFLISYGLMTMLIVEQSVTIESQRALIRELFHDSNELSAVKESQRAQTQAQLGKTPSHIPSNQVHNPSSQAPSQSAPSTQIPLNQVPSTQAVPQHRAQKTDKIDKPLFQAPTKPAQDQAEDRRASIVI